MQVILITGARKGIGRYLAEYYLGGDNLVIGCGRRPSDLVHKNYEHYEVDVTKESDVKTMFMDIMKQHRTLTALINNAGIGLMNHFTLTPLETVKKIMETNFYGTFLICREAAKLMIPAKYGRIINISSVAVPMAIEGEAIYAASKSAVETFTRVIARELAHFNITCNCIGPGPVKTDLTKNVPEAKIQKIIDNLILKRACTSEDIAMAIDLFLNKDNGYITGQVIYLGGVDEY